MEWKYHEGIFLWSALARPTPYQLSHRVAGGNTMKGGQVQVNLIGNAGVTGRLWTLVLG